MANREDALFRASIDDNTGRFFKKMETRLNSVGANQAFDRLEGKINRVGKAAGETAHSKSSGIAGIGLAAGAAGGIAVAALSSIVNKLLEMKEQITAIIAESIKMNQEVQTAEKLFQTLFGGGEEGAKNAALFTKEIRILANELGISTEAALRFSRVIAPDAKSVGELKDLIKLTDAFADAESRAFGELEFAVNAAVGGQLRSLGVILGLTARQKAKIKGLQDQYGQVAGTVKALQELAERKGIGGEQAERLAGTAALAQKQIEGVRNELVLAAGEAPFKVWNEQLNVLATFLKDNQEDLVRIAAGFGDVVAMVFELGALIRGGALGAVDMEKVADKVDEIVIGIKETSLQVVTLYNGISNLLGPIKDIEKGLGSWFSLTGLVIEPLLKIIELLPGMESGVDNVRESIGGPAGILGLFGRINDALETLNQIVAVVSAGWQGIFAGIKPSADAASLSIQAVTAALSGNFEESDRLAKLASKALAEGFFDVDAATSAATDSMIESVTAMEQAREQLEEFRKERDARGEDEDGGLDPETELPGVQAALEREKERRIAAAKDLIAARIALSEQLVQNEIRNERRITNQLIAESRRREDIERNKIKRLNAIEKNRNKAIAALRKDNQQDETKFDEDAQEERSRLDKQRAESKISLEKQLQRKLLDIEREFMRSAREAALDNDAIAFLQAKRNAADKREDALSNAQGQTEDANEQFEKQKQDLEKSLSESRENFKSDLTDRIKQINENAEEQRQLLAERLKEQEENNKISLVRRGEDEELALERSEEDQLRSLEKQLTQLKEKHGEYIDETAQGLRSQSQEWIDAYSTDSPADITLKDFFTRQAERLGQLQAEIAETSDQFESLRGAGGGAGFGGRANPSRIGQAGLVSDFLASPTRVSLPSPSSGGGTARTDVSNSEQNLNFNFHGVEPFLQRIAIRAATEVQRNIMLGRN